MWTTASSWIERAQSAHKRRYSPVQRDGRGKRRENRKKGVQAGRTARDHDGKGHLPFDEGNERHQEELPFSSILCVCLSILSSSLMSSSWRAHTIRSIFQAFPFVMKEIDGWNLMYNRCHTRKGSLGEGIDLGGDGLLNDGSNLMYVSIFCPSVAVFLMKDH